MFKAHCVTVRDPFHPQRHREVIELSGPGPIGALAPKTKQPFIILRNGVAVLRADWHQPVSDGDLMAVVLLPQGGGGGGGGGGSNVLQVVLMIVVVVLSVWTGGAVGAAYGAAWGTAAQVAVGIVGSALVNALVPPPRPQGVSNSGGGTGIADMQRSSPTYNISAQGNTARLESAIPIQYGRMQVYPDFAASPYVEYAGNEQYLYQLFCIGVGEYEIESIRIEDTNISNFEEVQYEVVGPGEALDLFPSAISTSVEVSGQEALYYTPIGPFVANPAETSASRLGIDVVCPRGLYRAEATGGLSALAININIQIRAIDQYGDPVGGWITLANEVIWGATTTPLRRSFNYSVTPGRYEVQLMRTDGKSLAASDGHEVVWAGLRAYLVESSDFGNVTLLAVKIRATNNLSQQSSRKINVICTRRLYEWTGASWAGPYPSRSIAWALYDACKQIGLPDSRIDMDALVAHDQTWKARGDYFDARFDSTTTFWEALTNIGRAGRCKPYMQGGIIRFCRDEAVSLPVALYSMRNIGKGSFSLEFITPSNDTADAVEVSYFDSSTWKPRRLLCKLPGSVAAKPAKVDMFGVTSREQAYREGIYLAAANRYRRTLIKLTTEMEGFIPSYGDLVAINHDMPQWGQHGEVVDWDAATNTAELSEPMTWDAGTHYCGLRRRDGSLAGPYVVTPGPSPYHLEFAEAPDFVPYIGQEAERTHITFGWGDTWRQLARVLSIRPKNANTVELVCVNEDASVHTADQGVTAPPVLSSQLPRTPAAPAIIGLDARSMPGNVRMMLISWQPAPGAEYYIIEQSVDGESWTRTGETRAANFTANALYGSQTIVRVAAVGALRGSWASFNYALLSDYMWASDPDTPMWSGNDNLMWS